MEVKIMSKSRSVFKDALTMSMGVERILTEISLYEALNKRSKSVKKRLERLYMAREQLVENPKESADLVKQFKETYS
jgi:hypothetical protein